MGASGTDGHDSSHLRGFLSMHPQGNGAIDGGRTFQGVSLMSRSLALQEKVGHTVC